MTASRFHPGSGWEPADLFEQIDPTAERVYYQDGHGNSYVWKPKPAHPDAAKYDETWDSYTKELDHGHG